MLFSIFRLVRLIRQTTMPLFLTLAILLSLTIKAETQLPTRLQPQLLALAQSQPESQLDIIVRSAGEMQKAQQAVLALGGQILDNLSLINAFTARISAQHLIGLGRVPSVGWVSLDSPVASTQCSSCVNTANLASAYIKAIGADLVWNRPPYLQGQGIGIAVVDSGVNPQADLYTNGQNRLVASAYFNGGYNQHPYDDYGHGNHVAGIIGGNGYDSNGTYIGVAPAANIINVKVSDEEGRSTVSNVIKGLQWIFENAATYNIRVVNISLNDTVSESYHTSALDAAVEALWFNGIVVVVSAGNGGSGSLYAPANDPFVITVGAINDKGTVSLADDTMPAFSAYGTTTDGFAKPDLVAPGMNIFSLLMGAGTLVRNHPGHLSPTGSYFRMSGTSMAAPIVAGAAALVIQANPNLTPDQVKSRLKATARAITVSPAGRAGAGYLNVDAAVTSTSAQKANQNISVSRLFSNNQKLVWNSATAGTVSWRSRGSDYWVTANGNSDLNNTASYSNDYWDDGVQSAEVDGEEALDIPITIATEDTVVSEQPVDTVATRTLLFLPTVLNTASADLATVRE